MSAGESTRTPPACLEVDASVAIKWQLAEVHTDADGQYVALAIQMESRLETADETLYNALEDGPLGACILWVEDDPGIPDSGSAEGS